MGWLNFVIAAIGRCADGVSLLLDLNFIVVHTVVRSILTLVAFVHNLPVLLCDLLVELWNCVVLSLVFVAETASAVAHGAVNAAGSCALAMAGVLESLKMVGYLSTHVLLRGRECLYRVLLSVLECFGIAASLVVYLANTVVNYVLIATQNVCSTLVGVWQTVSSPLQKVLELTLTLCTFLYSSLVGTSNLLWTPCKLVLDFLLSLTHIFVSIFIMNVYGLLLTVTITVATTVYLNPELSCQWARRALNRMNSVPGLHRLSAAVRGRVLALQRVPNNVPDVLRQLQRMRHHLYLLERRLWRQLSQQGSWLSQAMRTQVLRDNSRVGGDGDPGGERRDPPDGRAGEGAGRAVPGSSTDRPLKKRWTSGKGEEVPTAESLLDLLKEQEERKKCVICQDCTKTVVLLPCRHLCLCRNCTHILLRQPIYQQNCPLCRHMILNTMDVYL